MYCTISLPSEAPWLVVAPAAAEAAGEAAGGVSAIALVRLASELPPELLMDITSRVIDERRTKETRVVRQG